MRRRKTVILALLSILIAVAASTAIYTSYSGQLTGTEWFQKQDKYIDSMETYAQSMDDIFALYISGSISEEDFLNHISVLQSQLTIMEKTYAKAEVENPVKTGSHTYSSKKGCESVKGCYEVLNEILDMASKEENYSDIELLSYKYLTCQQEIIEHLADYMAASEIIQEESQQKEEEEK